MSVLSVEKKTWTTLELIQRGASYFDGKGFDESRLTTELLLAHTLGCTRLDLYTKFDRPLTGSELARFKALVTRRLAHEPLQYIVGTTEFMNCIFAVDQRAFIPRPETETLVETAVALCRQQFPNQEEIAILDLGTGSGCIAVSCARLIKNARVYAIDASDEAVGLAMENAKANGVEEKIQFAVMDLLAAVPSSFPGSFHFVLSNPPYISAGEFEMLQPEIRKFEPPVAVTDYADGLTFFRRIARFGRPMLREGGWAILEHAWNQENNVLEIFRGEGWSEIQDLVDYSKNPRCIIARK